MTELEKKKDIYILGQGTYGCVYRPEVDCKNTDTGSTEYISKIHQDDRSSKAEIRIGKLVKTIPRYGMRFGPIIDNCPVNYGKITNDELSACKMYVRAKKKKTDVKFMSSKLKYVGKHTLGQFLDSIIVTKQRNNAANASQYIKRITETHLYLLESITELNKKGVVHMDLKNNNIMYDSQNNVPIVIDFGLSYQMDRLNIDSYEKKATAAFGVDVKAYTPWCFEIIVLSYVARKISNTKKYTVSKELLDTPIVDVQPLLNLCNAYVDEMDILKTGIFDASEKEGYKNQLKKWATEFKGKTWRTIWKEVSKTYASWDNYGLSTMYLTELNISGLIKCNPSNAADNTEMDFLYQYVKELKSVILSDPLKRATALETRARLDTIFRKTSGKLYNEKITKFAGMVNSSDGQKRIINDRLKSESESVAQDRLVRRKMV